MQKDNVIYFQVTSMTDELFFKEVGNRIKQLRNQANLTQVQLADILDVKQQVIASYEIGRRKVPASCLPQLSNALGVSVESLLGLGETNLKRGPSVKLQRQIELMQRLPKSKQRFVSEFLDTVLSQAHA